MAELNDIIRSIRYEVNDGNNLNAFVSGSFKMNLKVYLMIILGPMKYGGKNFRQNCTVTFSKI